MAKILLVILQLLLVVLQAASGPSEQSMKFSVSSRRNQTGHWLAQVTLEHGDEQRRSGEKSHETGTWDVKVDQRKRSQDEGNIVQIIATVVAPPPRAQPSYDFVPGVGYYKLHTDAKMWDEAREVCLVEGGDLAIVNSKTEAMALEAFIAESDGQKNSSCRDLYFVGAHDKYTEGQHITVHGTPLQKTGYVQWSEGQPDDKEPGEDCVAYFYKGGLHDVPCSLKLGFFCEQGIY